MARNRRGTGTVYASEGGWIASYPLGIRNGKRVRKRVRCADQDSANDELDRLRRTYGAGGEPVDGTLDEYLRQWLKDVRPSIAKATYTSYEGHVRIHISPLLGGVPVARLRSSDVRRLIADRLAAGKSPATVRRIITTLQMALGQGVRDQSLVRNVAIGIRLPRGNGHEIRALTFEDADRICEAVAGDQFEALYVLLLYSGMRLGEAVALDWRDVDLDTGTIHIHRGKTRASARVVPLASRARDVLLAHRAASPRVGMGEPVFLGPRHVERLRGDVATHAFPRLLERAGLPRMRVHDLRHGTATLLLARGVPMRDIADLLGHSNPSVTMNVYAHVTEEMRREAVNSLNFRRAKG